jgi:hypothetical protein
MAGFIDPIQPNSAFGTILRSLSQLSRFGMKYEDMVVRNSQAVGMTESRFWDQEGTGFTEDDAFYWTLSHSDTRVRKYIAYFDRDYIDKRNFLRKFSLNGEIEFILDTVTDEAIVYDDKNYFAYPEIKNLDVSDKVKDKLMENFYRIYHLFNFQESILAWQIFKQLLIDGFIAYEIVYDDRGKKVIGFKELDATSLQPMVEKVGENDFQQVWVQYPKNPQMTRKLKNEQVIYISYAKGNTISRVSYIERLVRSYNILKIMENSRIIWNVMNASYRLKFIIPIGTQSPQKAMQTLGQIMSIHKEEIAINDNSGELTVNGRPKIQFYKNYLFPEKDGVSPTVETLNGAGPDFNIMDNVLYFFNKLKQDSKIPYARFAYRGGTPANNQVSIDSLERDEIRFEKFLSRLRSIYQELLIKPLYIQMCLDYPDLVKDRSFKTNLGLNFVRESEFNDLVELANLVKRGDFIKSLADMKIKVGEEEQPYFDKDFLIQRFLKLTPEQIELNASYKENEAKEAEKKGGGEKPAEGGEEEGGEAEEPEVTL